MFRSNFCSYLIMLSPKSSLKTWRGTSKKKWGLIREKYLKEFWGNKFKNQRNKTIQYIRISNMSLHRELAIPCCHISFLFLSFQYRSAWWQLEPICFLSLSVKVHITLKGPSMPCQVFHIFLKHSIIPTLGWYAHYTSLHQGIGNHQFFFTEGKPGALKRWGQLLLAKPLRILFYPLITNQMMLLDTESFGQFDTVLKYLFSSIFLRVENTESENINYLLWIS